MYISQLWNTGIIIIIVNCLDYQNDCKPTFWLLSLTCRLAGCIPCHSSCEFAFELKKQKQTCDITYRSVPVYVCSIVCS